MIAASEDLVGTVIDGRFEVLGRLGAGAMGTVYRARQRSVDREVAIKVLDRRFEADVTSVKRFFREAKVASTLSHPNTVSIIDFGQNADGRLYIAMELVRGHTLHDELDERGALPIARVIAIGAQLSDALEVAHGKPIVHRDLKLENVMLVEGGRDHVKVLDFGLALSLAESDNRATAVGIVSGTPRYMPPEVIEGAVPATAQDMYSLGVMLGELSTGLALWADDLPLAALFIEKRDPDKAVEDVPEALRPLIRSLLDVNAAARPTAASVRAELREIESALASPERRSVPRSLARTGPPSPREEMIFPEDIALVDVDGGGTPALPTEPAVAFRVPRPTKPTNELELELSAADRELRLDIEPSRRSQPLDAASVSPLASTKNRSWRTPIIAVVVLVAAAGSVAMYRQHSRASTHQVPTKRTR